jgi:hypothetical protein
MPVPTHAQPQTSGPDSTPPWELPAGDPGRKLDVRHPRGMAFTIGMGVEAAGVLSLAAGALLVKFGSVASEGAAGALMITGGAGALLAPVVWVGMPVHDTKYERNDHYDADVAERHAAASLVGRAPTADLADAKLVVGKVLSITDDHDAAVAGLVDKPTVDAMLAGKVAGRAVVELPRTGGEAKAYATVELRATPSKPATYPAVPGDLAEHGAAAPYVVSLLSTKEQRTEQERVIGKERWTIVTAATQVQLSGEGTLRDGTPDVLGTMDAHEVDRRFRGYVEGSK